MKNKFNLQVQWFDRLYDVIISRKSTDLIFHLDNTIISTMEFTDCIVKYYKINFWRSDNEILTQIPENEDANVICYILDYAID